MSNDSLATLGAAMIANAFNSYERVLDNGNIITVEEVLKMEPVSFSKKNHAEDNKDDVYAINYDGDTILARLDKDQGNVEIRVIRWWDETRETPTDLLERISDAMSSSYIQEIWIYPNKLVEKSSMLHEYPIKISIALLEKLFSILENMLHGVKIDDFDSENPCIHITKKTKQHST